MNDNNTDLSAITAEIVSSYVANNALAAADLQKLIGDVHKSLVDAASGAHEAPEEIYTPAVSVKASIKPDYLICLECGAKQKMMKRHLSSAHGLSPIEYIERYRLRPDYPLVAPSYSKVRSNLAKQLGLGRKVTRQPEKAVTRSSSNKRGKTKGSRTGS